MNHADQAITRPHAYSSAVKHVQHVYSGTSSSYLASIFLSTQCSVLCIGIYVIWLVSLQILNINGTTTGQSLQSLHQFPADFDP